MGEAFRKSDALAVRRFAAASVAVAALLVASAAVAAGSDWSIQPTPNPAGSTGGSTLYGVSCVSASACTAVGNYLNYSSDGTLAERWDGTGWSIEPTPPTTTRRVSGDLYAVSCVSATDCTAVGDYHKRGFPTVTLVESWNGTAWSIDATPNPPGARSSELTGVSCTSATTCTAVGDYVIKFSPLTLAERWDGTSWTIESTPSPVHGTAGSFLNGVSCVAASACIAVGSSGPRTLAERWNGTRWSIESTPKTHGRPGKRSLNGVWCVSAASCFAVGYANGPRVEHWNGTRWSIEPAPSPPSGKVVGLTSVSCSSASACTAVGDYQKPHIDSVTLAERWNGTKWSIEPTPNQTGAPTSQLNGVSCPSAHACTAAGTYFNSLSASSGGSYTLAEQWNGRS